MYALFDCFPSIMLSNFLPAVICLWQICYKHREYACCEHVHYGKTITQQNNHDIYRRIVLFHCEF